MKAEETLRVLLLNDCIYRRFNIQVISSHIPWVDVVIGAPYEDGKGAVYLYLGGPSGLIFHPATIYWQRIAASELAHPLNALSGFGISLNSADIDDNDYPGRILLMDAFTHHLI